MLSISYLRLPTDPKKTKFRSEQEEICRLLFDYLTTFLLNDKGVILFTCKQVQVIEYDVKLFIDLN